MYKQLIPNIINSLLDGRGIVDTVEDIYNIPNPAVGLQVYCKEDENVYVITSLKNNKISDTLSIINGAVLTFKQLNGFDYSKQLSELSEDVGALSTHVDEQDANIKTIKGSLTETKNDLATITQKIETIDKTLDGLEVITNEILDKI